MHHARFVLLAAPLVLLTALAEESSAPDGPGINQLCTECGVIYEIREMTSERATASTSTISPFQDQGAPPARSMISIPLTNKPEANKPQIDVYGTRSMRRQLEEVAYEVVIRYDDGRFTRREVSDVTDLYIGVRVRVSANRIELDDR